MDEASFYRLRGPTSWAKAPERYSFSSLRVIEECPRRWLLERSEYADLPRYPSRPQSATEAGTIIHSALEHLFRALALQGMPAIGSAAFREAMRALDLMGFLQQRIDEHTQQIALHPRSAGYKVSFSARDLYNKVVPLFQAEYHPSLGIKLGLPGVSVPTDNLLLALQSTRALSELPLQHPTLPLHGVIDLVREENGACLIDFKSGKEKPEHQAQLELYGVLWWRVTGQIPSSAEVRYPNHAKSFELDEARLLQVEEALINRLKNAQSSLSIAPGEAQPGEHCRWCSVRQFCEAYWKQPKLPSSAWVDIELSVKQSQSENGFLGQTTDGTEIPVVFDKERSTQDSFTQGTRLRILGACREKGELRLMQGTEVFYC